MKGQMCPLSAPGCFCQQKVLGQISVEPRSRLSVGASVVIVKARIGMLLRFVVGFLRYALQDVPLLLFCVQDANYGSVVPFIIHSTVRYA
jgi:hypothetical protein